MNQKMKYFLDTVKVMLDDLLQTERNSYTVSIGEKHRKTMEMLNNSLDRARARKDRSWEALKQAQEEYHRADKAYVELIQSKEQAVQTILWD